MRTYMHMSIYYYEGGQKRDGMCLYIGDVVQSGVGGDADADADADPLYLPKEWCALSPTPR